MSVFDEIDVKDIWRRHGALVIIADRENPKRNGVFPLVACGRCTENMLYYDEKNDEIICGDCAEEE